MPKRKTTPAQEAPPAWEPDLRGLPTIVHSARTDAVYNCHAYLTKVPIEAIKPFIETFTRPGEVVVDIFAGSGMTGLAAVCLGRAGAISDISVLGQHIATGYFTCAPPEEIRRGARHVVDEARSKLGDLYGTRRVADGAEVEMVRTIWSFVYMCANCRGPLVYFEHLDSSGKPPKQCPRCPTPFVRRTWPRAADVPVRVVVDGMNGKQVEQLVQPIDEEQIARASKDVRLAGVPSCPISPSREMFGRSGLRRAGISETKQFFSPRNAIALVEIWSSITKVPRQDVRKKLTFAFTACLARASRRYQWGPVRPLNAQNQTYYIAPVYLEWNVFELFQRKVDAVLRADAQLFKEAPAPLFRDPSASMTYNLTSADRLKHLADASADYVFTDPPFGSNIFYSDMNLFHEAWLGQITDDSSEAVMHTSGPKRFASAERYEHLLRGAFREAYRVLKPNRFMSVVFGNSSGNVWSLVQRAIRDVGFLPPVHIAILDKGQRSVKGLNSGSEGVVTVDLVLTVKKPSACERQAETRTTGLQRSAEELLRAAAANLKPQQSRNPSYVYAAVVREALAGGRALDDLHYSDLLIVLRNAGFRLDPKKGLLDRPVTPEDVA